MDDDDDDDKILCLMSKCRYKPSYVTKHVGCCFLRFLASSKLISLDGATACSQLSMVGQVVQLHIGAQLIRKRDGYVRRFDQTKLICYKFVTYSKKTPIRRST